MEIQYIGEHLIWGKLGHFFVVLGLVSALFSALSYFWSAQSEGKDLALSGTWHKLGRAGFFLHCFSVFAVFSFLYYIIANHYFEYHYVWRHSDLSLPMKYLLSCFWEGQEGSFLLWTIWHAILGLVVLFSAKAKESRVMTVIAVIQALLVSMILGVYLGEDIRIGTTPFSLLRDEMAGAPVFMQPNYLELIGDGNGLNILLQNYWMVIHPPVLFLGFSAALIPFAYVLAALWQGDYKRFVQPTLHWSLFAGATLGLGIMMGGAWAYESLTFGGYWAWDPVENASLVPWLLLVAGIHMLVVYKATGRSLIATLLLLIASYLFIWYSTFLTRTGILGDTSVHSFTGEGNFLYWHLIFVIALLLIASLGLLIYRWKELPRVKKEEEVSSREFWMFIGSFVLFLSSMQIIISTSIPVWAPLAKMITGKDIAPPVDPISHYNDIQIWVAIIVSIMTATVLFLRFKKSDMRTVGKRLGITGAIALLMTICIAIGQKISGIQYLLLLFGASYTIVAMIYYAIRVQKAQLSKLGPAISHLGFGLVLMGILLSSYNKEVISINTLGILIDFGREDPMENARESSENVLLFINTPVVMGDYLVTYMGDSIPENDPRTFYKVHYERRDLKTGELKETFMLYPEAFVNPKGQEGLSANPDSKHYLTKDVFTYVTSVINPEKRTDTTTYQTHKVKQGDTVYLNNAYLVFEGFETKVDHPAYIPMPEDIAVTAKLRAFTLQGELDMLEPVYFIRGGYQYEIEDTLSSLKLYTRLSRILPDEQAAELMIKQLDPKDDYIVMKALIFPYINVLWLGIVVMTLGFFLTLHNRRRKSKKLEAKTKAAPR